MNNTAALLRSLVIYAICLPLAVVLGYMVTDMDYFSTLAVCMVIGVLLLPLLLRWHQLWLIATWNTTMVMFILPGRPQIWMLLAWVSLLIAFLQYILNRNLKFLSVPVLVRPIIFMVLVILITAQSRGGFGLAMFGSEVAGGGRYFLMLCGVAGYFAMISRRIPAGKEWFYIALFFLGLATQAIGELVAVLGQGFYYLALVFPVQSKTLRSMLGTGVVDAFFGRLTGFPEVSRAMFCVMLARYPIAEIFSWRYAWRFLLFVGFAFMGMLGGFRSLLLLYGLTFAALFYFEGLLRSRLMPVFVIVFTLGAGLALPFANRLPFSVQRALSVLPIDVDPLARESAEATSGWRIGMWQELLPEIPKYLWLGKGLGINMADLAMIRPNEDIEASELSGDYHSGPLSLIIQFGIWGVIGFLWLVCAGLRVLYRNYRYGNPAFRTMNRFLLAYFIAKLAMFLFVVGGIHGDLPALLGLLGVSVSLNGGEARKPVTVPQPVMAVTPQRFVGARQPVGA